MRKALFALLMLLAPLAFAQGSHVRGTVTAADTTCSSTPVCVSAVVPLGHATAAIQLTGTFSATVQFEESVNGSTWVGITGTPVPTDTGATSATAPGVWVFHVSAAGQIRVRGSAFTSGVVTVNITTSTGAP